MQSSTEEQKKYKTVPLDKVGEFSENGYFLREQMQPIPVTYIGKINFGYSGFYRTLDFTDSDLKPSEILYDSFQLDDNTSMSIFLGDGVSIYSEYKELDAGEYKNIVEGYELNLFYQPGSEISYYHLIVSQDEYSWMIHASFRNDSTYYGYSEAEAKENIKKMMKLIPEGHDETAPTAVDFIAQIPNVIKFSFATFDFNHEDIEVNTYSMRFNDENGYQLYSLDMGQSILYKGGSLNLYATYVPNIYSYVSVQEVKEKSKNIYELNINDRNLRAYIDENENLIYLGFVENKKEYIVPVVTKDLTLEEIFKLLYLIIK